MNNNENLFLRYGYSVAETNERLTSIWSDIFEGPNRFYTEVAPDMAYVVDTGNDDVRSEGMSYGMMLAVQYDQQNVFDRLWKWAMTYMYMEDGKHAHYFAWSVDPSGTKNHFGPAPDGEEFFAMALFFASNRWGDKAGIFHYSEQARRLLHYCVHKGEKDDELPMWERTNHLIKFIPEVNFTDPSYHVPHFYEQFAQYANEEDQLFWQEAARASREHLKLAMHAETGLNPEYAHYDGRPYEQSDHYHFYSDAYRTALNIAVDSQWYGKNQVLCDRLEKLQYFFAVTAAGKEDMIYTVEGENTGAPVLHPIGLLATLAAASAAIPEAPYAKMFVDRFWQTPLRKGKRRYYDNFLYAFSFLVLSGNYNIY